jgi:hypothetical protein
MVVSAPPNVFGLNTAAEQPNRKVKKSSRPSPQPIIAPADIFTVQHKEYEEEEADNMFGELIERRQRRNTTTVDLAKWGLEGDSDSPQEVRFYMTTNDPLDAE